MIRIKQTWHYWYGEPMRWIMYCFFQPLRFEKEINTKDRRTRYVRMCRLAFPLLILIYPITLIARFMLYNIAPQVYGYYATQSVDSMLASTYLFPLFLNASWAVLLALAVVMIMGPPLVGLSYCITAGLVGCFWGGVAVQTGLGTPGYLLIANCVIGALGLTVGVAIASGRDIKKSSGEAMATAAGSIGGIVIGIAMGFGLGLLAAQVCGTAVYSGTLELQAKGIAGSALSAMVGAVLGAVAMVMVTGVVRGIGRTKALLHSGVERALALGMVTSIACSAAIGGVMGTAYGASGSEIGYRLGIDSYVLPNLPAFLIFLISYVLGLYRLPLYPFSAFSTFNLDIKSYYRPTHVFSYIYQSSLYWDEAVYLPLPGLKHMLYRAIEVDIEETLRIATFIVKERVLQLNEVRPVVREVILRDLEERETLEQIARAHTRLTEIIPEEALLIDPRWQLPFIRLGDASLEAARLCTPQSRQSRLDTLEQIILNLKRVPIKNAFENVELNKRLEMVVQCWLAIARHERDKLGDTPETIGNIGNPYICGPALKANTEQFVGRQDLAAQLQQELNKGSYRPSLFLQGERRTGKTSTLNQLPWLLGARYLPIIFDLQSRGMTSNIATFLGEIAQGIHNAMSMRGMPVIPLDYVVLQAAKDKNEATVYHRFDTWLTRHVERVLAREDRTILITFDEFEKLEEAGKSQYLDLNLLLDWFRSTMQNRTRLALLFSGIKALNEMESNWPGYFVNVRTLRVTFLRPVEALRLIMRPVNNYPGEQIFTPDAVEEIMRVTGRHPFLLQAVCSELIELLNAELREQATVEDVQEVVKAMFEHWEDTYFADLWRRTSHQQRLCLNLLQSYKQANLAQMLASGMLEQRVLQDTLQELRRRDLVSLENGYYQIATPIHMMWIEQTSVLRI
jgi:hypothetical protein